MMQATKIRNYQLWREIKMTKDQNTFFKELGERIALTRKDQGLSQAELAQMINASQQIVASYEAGERNIPVWKLIKVAQALGVNVETLINGKSQKEKKRGPSPKILQQFEQMQKLPKEKQKTVAEVLQMALNTT